MDKKEIKAICVSIINAAFLKVDIFIKPRIIKNIEDQKNVNSYIENQADIVMQKINKVNYSCFKNFLKEPQIFDLLVECLKNNIIYKYYFDKNKQFTLLDDCINYCLVVIEKNFQELTDNDNLIETKLFLNELLNPNGFIEFFLPKDLGRDIIEDKFFAKGIITNDVIHKRSKNAWRESEKLIESKLNDEFIIKNNFFVSVKNEYQKVLKQIYQIGFVYFVGEFKFNEFYIPPVLMEGLGSIRENYYVNYQRGIQRKYINIREGWKNIFCNSNIVYVIGGPGYGKSLFLRNVINNYTKLKIENIQEYLMIYCDLKTFYSNGNANKKTVIDFLEESMINLTGASNISKEFIEYYLKRGRCVVLLDALDEVPKNVRSELHKKVVGYFSMSNSNNKICITSRDRGFIPQERIEVFHINPLSSHDIEEYLDKMIVLKKFKVEEKETFLKQAKMLIEKEFLNNFLVLSLLVNIYKAEKELPENKIDLYKKCFDYIAKKREEEKSKTGYEWDKIYPLMKDSTFISLSTLAAPNNTDIRREDVEELLKKQYKVKYLDEVSAECAIKEFLEFCSNRTELFVPSSVDDKFKFFHRSFFEYFYSRYIHQQSIVAEMYKLMEVFDIDSEVFELTVALVKEDNEMKYQELLDFIFLQVKKDFTSEHPTFISFGILTLAMQVVDDLYYIEKFFSIVVSYPQLMKNGKVASMNQRLLMKWVINAIKINDDNKETFKKVYETDCIIYVLDKLSRMKKDNFRYINKLDKAKSTITMTDIVYQTETQLVLDGSSFQNNINMSPFFILVYIKYFKLGGVISLFNKKTIAAWINEQNGLTKKQKHNLNKGRIMYELLEKENPGQVLEQLCIMVS
ncbi:MAG: NACHT domain-containing protein [Candidatus Gastranaerophilales bacterium]|nr:NACHT domain-containing protein [Candidatus Gastranaerophilales bacterium]